MELSISELRDRYVQARFHRESLVTAIKCDKSQAATLVNQIEELRLQSLDCQQAIDDLHSVNNRYESRISEFEKLELACQKLQTQIYTYYDSVIDGQAKLDWSVTLLDGLVYSGWLGQRRPGKLCLVDKELCFAELKKLQLIAGFYREIFLGSFAEKDRRLPNIDPELYKGKYWLVSPIAEYRDTCVGERDGLNIAQNLESLLVPKQTKPIFDLPVLEN